MHRLKLSILCLVSIEDHFQLVIKVIMQIFPIANQHTPAMFWKRRYMQKEYPQNTKVLPQQISLWFKGHGGCYALKTDNHRSMKINLFRKWEYWEMTENKRFSKTCSIVSYADFQTEYTL